MESVLRRRHKWWCFSLLVPPVALVAGLAVLLTFVLGLVIANSVFTFASVYGFAQASKRQSIQIGLGLVTSAMSVGIGVLLLLGNDGALCAFLTG